MAKKLSENLETVQKERQELQNEYMYNQKAIDDYNRELKDLKGEL